MIYELEVTEQAMAVYTVEATSADEAKAKLSRGVYDSFRDLGHDNMEILNVKEAS